MSINRYGGGRPIPVQVRCVSTPMSTVPQFTLVFDKLIQTCKFITTLSTEFSL